MVAFMILTGMENTIMSEIDVFNIPVFPVADLFPMIPTDELAELAEDIQENGLQEPIVIAKLNGEWLLVDGRNRLAACQLAGITPHYRILDSDPTAYVLSANVHRRHLTKGQAAMGVALAYPDAQHGGDRKSSLANKLDPKDFGFSKSLLSQARFVLRHCRDKAEEVLRNAKYPLTVAYEEAQAIVEKQKRDEEERQEQLRKLALLREEFSDLAALVDDQRLGLPEAIAAGDQRREAARLKAEREEQERLDKIRREREAEEARMAEEDRKRYEQERQEQERFEANRAAFHSSLSQLLNGSVIIINPADCVNPNKWKGTWTKFYSRYQISIQDARERLNLLQERIPFILETLESMRDE